MCGGSAGPGGGRRGRLRARDRRRGGDDEAALLVPLHVLHAPQGLNLRAGSLPVVPVLEVALLEDELAPPVARIQVSHPPVRVGTTQSSVINQTPGELSGSTCTTRARWGGSQKWHRDEK